MFLFSKESIRTKKLVLLWKCITMIIRINNPIVLGVTLLYLLPYDLKENKKENAYLIITKAQARSFHQRDIGHE